LASCTNVKFRSIAEVGCMTCLPVEEIQGLCKTLMNLRLDEKFQAKKKFQRGCVYV
jgi:hypothetical protein